MKNNLNIYVYPPSSIISYHSLNLFVFWINIMLKPGLPPQHPPKKHNLWSINLYPPKNRGERFEGNLYNIHLTTLQHYILQLFVLVDIFLGFFPPKKFSHPPCDAVKVVQRAPPARSSMVSFHLLWQWKLIWQWKLPFLIGGYFFKWLFFHCHISFQGCIPF